MTIYGIIFRLFGWAIGLGLIFGQLTTYNDGHHDTSMVWLGVGILSLWVITIGHWLYRNSRAW